MKKIAYLIISAALLAISAAAAEHKTLLLSHFNSILDADTAEGSKTAGGSGAAITAGGKGYPFNNSSPAAEGLDLTQNKAWLTYPAQGNFDLKQGTIQMWIKSTRGLNWQKPGKKYWSAHYFFQLQADATHRFTVFKAETTSEIYFCSQNGQNMPSRTWANVSQCGSNEWHQLTMTWKEDGLMKMYLDGQPGTKGGAYYKMDKLPGYIEISAHDYGHDAEAVIDELRIADYEMSPEEIKADYDWMKAGHELPRIEKGTAVQEQKTPSDLPLPAELAVDPLKELRAAYGEAKIKATWISSPVTIDGKLDEDCWEKTEKVGPYLKRFTKNAAEPNAATYLLYDAEKIYVGCRVEEPEIAKLKAEYKVRGDRVWSDDSMEFFFDTRKKVGVFYQFVINSLGTIAEIRTNDRDWRTKGIEARTFIGKDFWSLEMAIPFKDFDGASVRPGCLWGFKSGRNRVGPIQSLSTWPSLNKSFSCYDEFATLTFGISDADTKDISLNVEEPTDLYFGLNRITGSIENKLNSKCACQVQLDAVTFDNEVISSTNKEIALPAKDTGKFEIGIPVLSEKTAALFLTVRDFEDKKIKSLKTFSVNIPNTYISLKEMQDKLAKAHALRGYIPGHHVLGKKVLAQLDKVKETIDDFENNLARAVKSGQKLSPSFWDKARQSMAKYDQLEKKYAFLAWGIDPWVRTTRDALPATMEGLDELTVNAAINEYESAAFMLSNLLVPLELDTRVLVEDLKDESSGNVLLGDKIEVREAVFVQNDTGAFIPDVLVYNDANRFTVPMGQSRQVWLTVDTYGAKPGHYQGEIVIRRTYDSGVPNPDQTLKLHLNIWNVALPEKLPIETIFFTGPGGYPYFDLDSLAKSLVKHRVSIISRFNTAFRDGGIDWTKTNPKTGRPGARRVFDDEERQKMVDAENYTAYHKYGLKVDLCYPDKAKKLEIPKGYYYGFVLRDEPGHDNVPDVINKGKKLKEKYGNEYLGIFNTLGGIVLSNDEIMAMNPYVDIWMPALVAWFYPQTPERKEHLAFFKSLGKPIWTYQCGTPMKCLDVLDYYRLPFWQVFYMGLDGYAIWCLSSIFGDPWLCKDRLSPEYDTGDNAIIYFGGKKGEVLDSKRLESYREGADDYLYLYTLKEKIKQASAKNIDVTNSKKLLEDAVSDVLKGVNDSSRLNGWRVKILQEIENLNAKL